MKDWTHQAQNTVVGILRYICICGILWEVSWNSSQLILFQTNPIGNLYWQNTRFADKQLYGYNKSASANIYGLANPASDEWLCLCRDVCWTPAGTGKAVQGLRIGRRWNGVGGQMRQGGRWIGPIKREGAVVLAKF